MFFSFFCFMPLVIPIIYKIILQQHIRKLENQMSGSNENQTNFRLSFYYQLLKSV